MAKIPDTSRIFVCRTCRRETRQIRLNYGRASNKSEPLQGRDTKIYNYNVFRCAECETTTYCIDSTICPGPMIGDSYVEETEYFPPLIKRVKPSWFDSLSSEYQEILSEVYTAIDNELKFLASSGTRTALDQLIVEKIGDIGGFDHKLEKLVKENIIDEEDKEMLKAVIDAGSASAHRSYKPDDDVIGHMMDILETIFFKLLIEPDQKQRLREKAKQLSKATPKRKKA